MNKKLNYKFLENIKRCYNKYEVIMIFNKNLRKIDKNIVKDKDYIEGSNNRAIISIKADEKEKIFSSYDYGKNVALNPELDGFIWDKAKSIPLSKDIKIKFYTNSTTNEKQVVEVIRNNYKKEYVESKNELKRNALFSLRMFILGLLFLSFLLLMHTYFYNIYTEIVVEIATWVFIWEAVDSFFLQRAELKRKQIILLKLYSADIEMIKLRNYRRKSKSEN